MILCAVHVISLNAGHSNPGFQYAVVLSASLYMPIFCSISVNSGFYSIPQQASYGGEYSATFHFEFTEPILHNHMIRAIRDVK